MNILLIPGLGNGIESWNWRLADIATRTKMQQYFTLPEGPTIEELLTDRFTVYSFTPPLFTSPFTLDDYINWIFTNLSLPPQFYILAHSIGSIVAAKIAALYPDRVIKLMVMDSLFHRFVSRAGEPYSSIYS